MLEVGNAILLVNPEPGPWQYHRGKTVICAAYECAGIDLNSEEVSKLVSTGPIIFIGVPRSGTTAIFERFASHPDLGWLSNYSRLFPRFPIVNLMRPFVDNRFWRLVGTKNQFGDKHSLNRLLPRPDESYEFWEAHAGREFSRAFLLGRTPSDQATKRLRGAFMAIGRYQRRERVAAKLTGPGRVAFLNSVFPNALFVHVIRDAFGVIRSLLNVEFWKAGGGLKQPWWEGGLTLSDKDQLDKYDYDPVVLAALQWRRIIETTIQESQALDKSRFVTVYYEEYCRDPLAAVTSLWNSAGLSTPGELRLDEPIRSKDYADSWSPEEVRRILECIEPVYSDLGYPRGYSP